MKYIKQFGIILLISFLGEILRAVIPLPIPASIYGLVLMLAALMTHLLPLEAVQDSGKFLIEIMPLMFIPAAVGLLDSWSDHCCVNGGSDGDIRKGDTENNTDGQEGKR